MIGACSTAAALVLQLQYGAAGDLQHSEPAAPTHLQRRPTCSAARLQRHPACRPYDETCRGGAIYTCGADGRWRRGVDCARTGAVCEVEPGGVAVCVEGGARPFP